eukprot:scaffold41177_cov41-Tisochrysis_lutea.AAC.4
MYNVALLRALIHPPPSAKPEMLSNAQYAVKDDDEAKPGRLTYAETPAPYWLTLPFCSTAEACTAA